MAESTPLMSPWLFNFSQGNLIQRIQYDANNNAIYIGWAQPGTLATDAAWRIVQNTYTSPNGTPVFTVSGFPGDANGNPSCAFAFVWNNAATYSYS
jgi:hypothetical protein